MLAEHLPKSKIVKAFNAIMMPHFDRDGQPAGSFDRRALPLAGDDAAAKQVAADLHEQDAAAKQVAADLHEQFGFDPVDVGALSEGWRFQPYTPVYCIRFNREWVKRALAEARK